jgi:cyclopropane-fatty-acyl-phospholipid synthase
MVSVKEMLNPKILEKSIYKDLFSNLFSDTFSVKFWDGEEFTNGTGNDGFRIILNEPISISEVIADPSNTFGEAYMQKKLEIEGNIQEVIESMYNNSKSFLRNKEKYSKLFKPIKNTLRKSKENISFHYDIGNEFYELWLDKSMTYSCGYFKSENDTLEQAQANKVDYILRKLNLKEGNTLLDIGCGWGELIINAVKKYKVNALGVTLSQEQMEKAKERIKAEGIENFADVKLIDYRQITDKKFDRIVSVGMIEHVGKDYLKEYFTTLNTLLNQGGISLLHCITSFKGGNNSWIDRYIFPGGYIPSLNELMTNITSEEFYLLDMESLRRHYVRTLENWSAKFESSIPIISKMKDESFIRMWRLYLNSCAASFQVGNIDVHQFLFSKGLNKDIPMTRSYLYE